MPKQFIQYGYYCLSLILLVLPSCQLNDNEKGSEGTDSSAVIVQSDTSWLKHTVPEYFNIHLPPEMRNMDLNPEASLESGYVLEIDGEVREWYVVVLVETKAEIDSLQLDFEFDAASYSEISVNSLGGNLEDFKVITNKPGIENINGLDCVVTETRGDMVVRNDTETDDFTSVYFITGIYEGKKAFYQVLTWCIEDQKQYFRPDMMRLVKSLTEWS